IGFGTGQSAAVLKGLGYRDVSVAEIAPGILEASGRYFTGINDNIQAAGGATVLLEDGRNVLLTRAKKYDLISMEVSSVWFSGATNIYSKGFYDLARARLKPGGVFQQWIQFHHIGTREVESILASVRAAFPWVTVWYFGGQGIIVAAEAEHAIVPDAKDRIHAYLLSRFKGNTEEAGNYLEGMLRAQLMDRQAVDRLWAAKPVVNHDWNRWLEYSTPRYNLSTADWVDINLAHLARYGTVNRAGP
ncbi:MAG: spermidine synthase, partial [Candidatus Solibacter usitatus]|nr:spermidine synthase [Candidatus Solibacter usitatus]